MKTRQALTVLQRISVGDTTGAMNVTREIETHSDALLALAAAATSTYDVFVYENPDEARQTHKLLLDAGASEFSPPFALLVIEAGTLVAMASAMPGKEVGACRMRAAMALGRAPWMKAGSPTRRRMQLAGRTFVPIDAEDYYFSRLAVDAAARGKGYGGKLMAAIEEEARAAGAKRLKLDVSPDHEPAIRLYQKFGFVETGRGEANDEQTGRTLVHVHMVKTLT